MAKNTTIKTSSEGDAPRKTKKSWSNAKKGKPTAYMKYMSRLTKELKADQPDLSAQQRKDEIWKRWKVDDSNPKKGEYSD